MELAVQWCSCLSHLWSHSNLSPILQIHSFIIMNFDIIINTIWGKRTFDHITAQDAKHAPKKATGMEWRWAKRCCVCYSCQARGRATQDHWSPSKAPDTEHGTAVFPSWVCLGHVYPRYLPIPLFRNARAYCASIRSMCFDFTGLMIKETALSLRTDFIK